jgi:hypothetical protein
MRRGRMSSTNRTSIARRTRRVSVLLFAVFLLPAAAVGPETGDRQLDSRALHAAAAIAGTPVTVNCVAPRDAGFYQVLGHADYTRRQIELQPSLCSALNQMLAEPAPPGTPASHTEAEATLVLTHEAVHLSSYPGRRSEALTECRALQLVHDAALAAGVDDTTARALGHEALRYDAQLPGPGDWRVGLGEIPNYRAPGCYDGGPLDIHPNSNDWPN